MAKVDHLHIWKICRTISGEEASQPSVHRSRERVREVTIVKTRAFRKSLGRQAFAGVNDSTRRCSRARSMFWAGQQGPGSAGSAESIKTHDNRREDGINPLTERCWASPMGTHALSCPLFRGCCGVLISEIGNAEEPASPRLKYCSQSDLHFFTERAKGMGHEHPASTSKMKARRSQKIAGILAFTV